MKAISGLTANELACTSFASPAASPAMPRKIEAASICIAADSNGLLGSGAPRAYSEPAAQADVVATSASATPTLLPPPGRTSTATPAKPITSPITAPRESRRPKKARSKSAT